MIEVKVSYLELRDGRRHYGPLLEIEWVADHVLNVQVLKMYRRKSWKVCQSKCNSRRGVCSQSRVVGQVLGWEWECG